MGYPEAATDFRMNTRSNTRPLNGYSNQYATGMEEPAIGHLYEYLQTRTPSTEAGDGCFLHRGWAGRSTDSIPAHLGINFLRPSIYPTAQTTDILEAMAHEIRGGVEAIFALMIDHDDWQGIGTAAHQLLHNSLGEKDRTINVDGFEFLAGTDVDELRGGILFDEGGKLGGRDQDFLVLFVAGGDVGEDFIDIQIAVAGADLGEGFGGLETATAAAANMITAEKGALRAGEFFQNGAHG